MLLRPWALLPLLSVAAAAAWALRRPMHQVVPVGSLELWRKALAALGPAAARRARSVSPAWLLLLCGAVLAAMSLAQPVLYRQRPGRLVGIAVYPSAELAGTPGAPVAPAIALLRRLTAADRVQLLLPDVLGGPTLPMAPDQAVQRLHALPLLPAKASELTWPEPPRELQHVYMFPPASLTLTDGPRTTVLPLPVQPGEVTIDAFAIAPAPATTQPAGAAATAKPSEALVAVRNHTGQPRRGQVRLTRQGQLLATLPYDAPAAGRAVLTTPLEDAGDWFSATIEQAAGYGAAAFLAARQERTARVALLGRDDPHVRKFLQLCPNFKLQADASAADAVIAVGADPASPVLSQRDIPALCIAPLSPPAPWQQGPTLGPLALAQAAKLEHPLLANVDLSAVAVRKLATWQSQAPSPAQRPIATIEGLAFLLVQQQPRRIYLSLDISPENTNFAVTEPAFVIFMANAMQYLLPAAPSRRDFRASTPIQLGSNPGLTPVALAPSALQPGPLAKPGVYAQADGALVAVSLTALPAAPGLAATSSPADPALPPPAYHAQPLPLWPALAIMAALLWLTGWLLRTR